MKLTQLFRRKSREDSAQADAAAANAQAAAKHEGFAVKFGEPEPVLDKLKLVEACAETGSGEDKYFEPPFSLMGLARCLDAHPTHGSIPYFLRDQVLKYFVDHPLLSAQTLGQVEFDLDVFGNAYLVPVYSLLGTVLRWEHVSAIYMRVLVAGGHGRLDSKGKICERWDADEIIHLKEYDPRQNIYGKPQYMGGLQSVLLGESASLFRRRYYQNGAHMGYVFYTNDPNLSKEMQDKIEQALSESKGPGNFRSMFVHVPNGGEKGVQILPVGELGAKDDYMNVKTMARSDVVAMWRIPPQLASVIPESAGGFGDISKTARWFFESETVPRINRLGKINEFLPAETPLVFNLPDDKENID